MTAATAVLPPVIPALTTAAGIPCVAVTDTRSPDHSAADPGSGDLTPRRAERRGSQATRWLEMFDELSGFIAAHGHTRVPNSYTTADGHALAAWVRFQRNAYHDNALEAARITRLEALPGWTWGEAGGRGRRRVRPTWDDMVAALTHFVTENGHARIPHRYAADGCALDYWVGRQRKAHLDNTLDPARAERLNALLGANWATPLDTAWDTLFTALTQFAAQHGHARVHGQHITSDGQRLGHWVSHQRRYHRQNRLDPARAARLEALPGWAWGDSRPDRWERGFAALGRFVTDNGHARVPQLHVTSDGLHLGQWVVRQREEYRRAKLDPARAARLEALPGWTWQARSIARAAHADAWERGFAALGRFVTDNGHARVPQLHVTSDGLHLGQWVNRQRRGHREGRLDAQREARLQALPGWTWNTFTVAWPPTPPAR